MSFVYPWWLPAGALVCAALFAVWRRYDARQRAALVLLVAPQLRAQLTGSISSSRRVAKRVLFAAAIALVFVALAAPQAGFRWEQIKRRGNDIVFAIDTSRSMDTPDVKPTRLARAKLAVGDFVDHLNGDAVGLVAFAGSAFLQTPITLDYGAFHESLNALDTHIIPRGGTDIASAIRETQAALHNRPGSDKVMILVTDGEDLEGDALVAAKAAAQQDGLKIFTVGVGTTNGDLIPLAADQGGGFLKDLDGHLVKSHLDETALKALAAATGGSYVPLGAANEGLDAIYQQALAPLTKHDLEAREHKVYTQRYQWPLGAALTFLIASLMIGTRRRSPATRPTATTALPLRRFGVAAAAILIAAGLLPIHIAHASPANAAKAYREGNFAAAARDFSKSAQENPQQPTLQFNAGAAAYKAGEYPQAAQAFEASVNVAKSGSSKRLAEQEDAYYNLGNTQYREGQKTQQGDRQGTIATWTQAIKSYTAALQLRADDGDSRFNRDLVQRKLDELKKEPPPQDKSKQDQEKQDQSKQNDSKQPQSGQGQPKPDQGKQDKSGQQQAGNNPSEPKAQRQPGQQGSAQQQPGQSPSSAQAKPPDQPEQGQQPPAPGAADSNGSPREGTPNVQTAQAGDDQRQPGEMSRAEARQLLDSVKNDQRHLPTAPLARNGFNVRTSNEPAKDW